MEKKICFLFILSLLVTGFACAQGLEGDVFGVSNGIPVIPSVATVSTFQQGDPVITYMHVHLQSYMGVRINNTLAMEINVPGDYMSPIFYEVSSAQPVTAQVSGAENLQGQDQDGPAELPTYYCFNQNIPSESDFIEAASFNGAHAIDPIGHLWARFKANGTSVDGYFDDELTLTFCVGI